MITYQQAIRLLNSVALVLPDQLDCDGCFDTIAELAEAERRGDPLSDALQAAKLHLSQCPCCAYEYDALLTAIDAAERSK